MKKYIQGFVVLLISLVALLQACDDFFVPNIEDKEIVILAPSEGYSSQSQTVTFWWEKLKGATHYELQIVTPSFNDIRRVDADTIMEVNQYVQVLLPGTYQWRIRGFNSEYSTQFQTQSFTVEYNSDLTDQEVVLKLPRDSFYTKNLHIDFSWFELVAAEQYIFEIRTSTGGAIINPFETTETEVAFPDDFDIQDIDDGFYRWAVHAVNWFSYTQPTYRTFALDRENPGKPVLTLPVNNDTLFVGNAIFSWQRTQTSIAPQFDSLYIYNISGALLESCRSDSTSRTVSLPKGNFLWKVRTFDRAGNAGEFSDSRVIWVIESGTDLTQQSLTLLTPDDNFYVNNTDFSFSWGSLPAAEKYIVSIKSLSGLPVVPPTETVTNSIHFTEITNYQLITDGTYKWSIVATNWFSSTLPSERTITIDRISPATPLLIAPAHNDTLNAGNIKFTWQRPLTSIAPIFDSLYVKNVQGQIVYTERFSIATADVTMEEGEFKWSVRSFDLAGNASDESEIRSLWIEP